MKAELIKLLKDNSEEVLQGLVPHIALTLDCLADSHTIGVDRMVCIVVVVAIIGIPYLSKFMGYIVCIPFLHLTFSVNCRIPLLWK